MKIHYHDAGHMTKIAAMAIYSKTLLESSLQEPLVRFQRNFV